MFLLVVLVGLLVGWLSELQGQCRDIKCAV
jgi:hypothetical protein